MKDLLPKIQSNDGQFHNGNPGTGEQGTRVTDTWLNNVQEHIRDFGEELKYLLQQAELEPNPAKKTQIYDAISQIIDNKRRTASTTEVGEVQLDSSTDSDAEDKAATPKAVNAVKALVTAVSRALNNYIPNSKKSSAVNSNSEDTVATSKGLKIVYDLANTKQAPADTLAGYGISNFKVETSTGDLNSYRTDGIYAFNSVSSSQNRPTTGSGILQVIAGGAGNERYCHQIFRKHYSDEVYERFQVSGSNDNWSPWRLVSLSFLEMMVGVPIPWMQTTLPSVQGVTFFAMNGQRFDRSRYPILAQRYPSGVLIDLRSEFIRGWDNGRNIDRGRQILSAQGDAIRNITGTFETLFYGGKSSGVFSQGPSQGGTTPAGNWGPNSYTFDVSKSVPTASENRPRNVAFQYICIAA